jgi:hypothetical protein
MKTSNIIIIAFATFIVAGMLILFVDAKQHKKNLVSNVSFKEFELPAFSVVVAEKGSDVHLDLSDSTFIKVEYLKDKPVPKKIYKVSNDTLYVYGGLRTFVKCPNFTSFIGNKPFWVGLKNFLPDTLAIRMNSGRLNFNTYDFTKTKANQKPMNLSVFATDSAYLNIRNLQLQNVSIKLNNANIDIICPSKYASLKLENKARIDCFDSFENLTVQKDTSSVFRVEENRYIR